MSYNGPDITVTAERAFDRSVEGRRVKLVFTSDTFTSLKPGMEGTAKFRDDLGILHVDWDNGVSLGLIPGIDYWTYKEER